MKIAIRISQDASSTLLKAARCLQRAADAARDAEPTALKPQDADLADCVQAEIYAAKSLISKAVMVIADLDADPRPKSEKYKPCPGHNGGAVK